MDLVTSALGGIGVKSWLGPSGDTSGTTDTANLNTAITALGSGGGTVRLAPGQFYVTCGQVTVTHAGVYIWGSGRWATVVNAVGTGAVFRMYTTTIYNAGNIAGGGIGGMVIDGANAGAGSCAIRAGDIFQLRFDVAVRNFQGTGSKGVWLDNNYFWAEQLTGQVWAEQCTAHVVFDNSANTSGQATGSFDRLLLDVFLDAKGKGDGVVFQNGAFAVNGRLGIYGNTDYGSALYYVLKLTGSNGGGFSLLSRCVLNIGMECNATSGTQPGTISFGTVTSNVIERCSGHIDFSGNNPFATANNWDGSFQFDGPVYGDGNLMRSAAIGSNPYKHGAISNGAVIHTRFNSVVSVSPSGAVTGVILQGPGALSVPGPLVTVINLSAFTVTFAVAGTSHVADGTADVIAALTAATYAWYADTGLWYRAV